MRIAAFLLSVLLFSCSGEPVGKPIVAVQPYEGFSNEKTVSLCSTIESFYHVRTMVLPSRKLYRKAFINVKSPRYRADYIIRAQKKVIPNAASYIVGLTSEDISTTKKEADGTIKMPASKYRDWGVMGLGYCPGNSCVVSDFRLRSKNQKLFFLRLKKVAVHEIGHNLGLPHCPNKSCVMTDAVERIATIDHAALKLCSACDRKIN
ncbi:matrixin family metalloprotease [Flavobacterium sp.]|uniref:matrixin family metalloprotease n=1 Tax=Flavobacterium sp. TaxID=239 RepID=UPI0026203E3B|nr:matrixin family metalloprotease [Flavobacterium sp.]